MTLDTPEEIPMSVRPITFQDEAIDALARHGSLSTRQLGALLAPTMTTQAVGLRIRRMVEAGDVARLNGHLGLTCWAATFATINADGLELPIVTRIGAATARHGHVVSEVVIDLQRRGHTVRTERVLRAEAAQRGHQLIHLPDMLREDPRTGLAIEAVEVELSVKATRRLDAKLAWYAEGAGPAASVLYLCADAATMSAVSRAWGRVLQAATAPPASVLRMQLLDGDLMERALQF